ncbi:CRISPR-associated helicase Cas3' [Sporolactobacillus sp. CQH2019]|uniref:CRISPR-associated helicase Cas3' n=1 Tax=Sporolactobacillus sp. CQH2019 TaxID=3023512 RepID=UPI002367BD83|nr:CRISPR-associated helicase Cas3' [Sporolactobacillus sp. CQH2019]MDD9147997.1 CRISPR-associated helicase Cas3' [Sporolactobacillus sp. CQH2019]
MSRQFVAHYRESDKCPQMVRDHLLEVKQLAESYGTELKIAHITGLAGMLHDLGKYTEAFQNYLWLAVFHPEAAPRRGSVDHASAGGKLLYEVFHEKIPRDKFKMILAEIVGNAIISHHSYLHDFLNASSESPYYQRVTKDEDALPEYSKAKDHFFHEIMTKEKLSNYVDLAINELKAYIMENSKGNVMEKLTLLSRFVFSCLIDADRTNTRLFEGNDTLIQTDANKLFISYYNKLVDHLNTLNQKPESNTPINRLRAEMSEQCDHYACRPSGIYTLSIPTGGGKTLASLRYALKHARLFGKKQILYVVPYTTIIEQNAEVIRKILDDNEHILEHHSNVVESNNENDIETEDGTLTVQEKLELAKDNWDCPIILTTMVQFLDTFYQLGSRNIRRLHHLTQAVIVFDEVQKVPIHCVALFNHALNFLNKFGQSSILLCTATQPALDFVHHRLEINNNGEIVSRLDQVVDAFKRVKIVDRSYRETFDNEKLANFTGELLGNVRNVLIILNTRSTVRSLYQILKRKYLKLGIRVFHLSTSMCAAHRERILGDIKKCLDPHSKEKIICISTQLIEAGVDISFECVIRSLAGLDSIAQAAGRCNRNGEYGGLRKVYIIDHSEEKLDSPALEEIRKGKAVAKNILADLHSNPSNYGGSVLSKSAMDRYFQEFFTEMNTKLDFNLPDLGLTMTQLLYASRDSSYLKAYKETHNSKTLPLVLLSSLRTAAENFYVIKNMTKSVIVPYSEGENLIVQLGSARSIDDLGGLLRKAQHYSINVYDQELRQLEQEGQLAFYLDGQVLALKESAYSNEYGLDIKGESGFDILIH